MAYIDLEEREFEQIPQRLCIRRGCPAYELEMKKRKDEKKPNLHGWTMDFF